MGSLCTEAVIACLCWCCWIGITTCSGLRPVSEYLAHYDALEYSTVALHNSHQRVRRSTNTLDNKESRVRLHFTALNRRFKLLLRPDTSTFVSNPEIVESDGTIKPLDISHIYQGELEDEPGSYVHGSIISGIFSGRIDSRDGVSYYVDKTEIHFPTGGEDGITPTFHSVIYAEHDVIDQPPRHNDETHRMKRSSDADSSSSSSSENSGCGLTKSEIYKWMEAVQNSAIERPNGQANGRRSDAYDVNGIDDDKASEEFYLRYARPGTGDSLQFDEKRRQKRQAANNNNRMCALFLQSDPIMWNYMTQSTTATTSGGGAGLGYSPSKAREEITALFASHVDGIKKIYQSTIFQYEGLGPFRAFTFAVHRIQINTSDDCSNLNTDNLFCKPNIDVSNFLNLNSLTNQDLYCLAYVFTYRDFSQGTLGLAWVGSPLRASGGLCERWKEYSENNKPVFKSLNTGIVTLVNYGSRVPPKVSTLTFAHEVGHNFGSPHDSGDVCAPALNNPSYPNGNYIMFASATSGDKPNNHNFSICSIGNMTQVLNAVLNQQYGKDNCFSASSEAFCGNRIVEGTEQCDCGFLVDCNNPDNRDDCCYARDFNDTTDSPFACQLKPNAKCSVSEGPCCLGNTCTFQSSASNTTCLAETQCSYASFCKVLGCVKTTSLSCLTSLFTGSSAHCPTPRAKPDLSLCNSNTQVCKLGDCVGSVCESIGWSVCYINAPANDPSYDSGLLCFVSCYNGQTGSCVSSGSQPDLAKAENAPFLRLLNNLSLQFTGIRMPAGMPCDNYRGYCDVFQKCRAVNEDGPLARLKNLLFSQQTIIDIRNWITTHWWAMLLMAVLLVILMALFIKVCAVHTPSSNPNQTPARKLTLPRRHAQRPQGPPPPYSEAGPSSRAMVMSGASAQPPHGMRQNRSRQQAHGSVSSSSSSRQHHPRSGSSEPSGGHIKKTKRSNIELKYHPSQV